MPVVSKVSYSVLQFLSVFCSARGVYGVLQFLSGVQCARVVYGVQQFFSVVLYSACGVYGVLWCPTVSHWCSVVPVVSLWCPIVSMVSNSFSMVFCGVYGVL